MANKTDDLMLTADEGELDALWEMVYVTDCGRPRMDLYKRMWQLADALRDYENRIVAEVEFMSEAIFHDDAMQSNLVLPELLRIHDEYVAQYGETELTENVLWAYKWIISNSGDFCQISKKQYDALCEDFKERCLTAGYSLRPYYQYRFEFYSRVDMEAAEEYYRAFLEEKRDYLSDCEACERNEQVYYRLMAGNIAEAKRLARELFDGSLSCSEVPEITYGAFLGTFNTMRCRMARGSEGESVDVTSNETDKAEAENDGFERSEAIDEKAAASYCEEIRRAIGKYKIALEFVGDVLLFYVLTDKWKALPYYSRYWSYFEDSKNPIWRFKFACAATRFFSEMKEKGTYRMKMAKTFPLYREDGEYQVCMPEEYYRSYAKECAERFDARNGSSYFGDMYAAVCG